MEDLGKKTQLLLNHPNQHNHTTTNGHYSSLSINTHHHARIIKAKAAVPQPPPPSHTTIITTITTQAAAQQFPAVVQQQQQQPAQPELPLHPLHPPLLQEEEEENVHPHPQLQKRIIKEKPPTRHPQRQRPPQPQPVPHRSSPFRIRVGCVVAVRAHHWEWKTPTTKINTHNRHHESLKATLDNDDDTEDTTLEWKTVFVIRKPHEQHPPQETIGAPDPEDASVQTSSSSSSNHIVDTVIRPFPPLLSTTTTSTTTQSTTTTSNHRWVRVWTPPIIGRDEGFNLIGRRVRCQFPVHLFAAAAASLPTPTPTPTATTIVDDPTILEGEVIRCISSCPFYDTNNNKPYKVELLVDAQRIAQYYPFLKVVVQDCDNITTTTNPHSAASAAAERRIRDFGRCWNNIQSNPTHATAIVIVKLARASTILQSSISSTTTTTTTTRLPPHYFDDPSTLGSVGLRWSILRIVPPHVAAAVCNDSAALDRLIHPYYFHNRHPLSLSSSLSSSPAKPPSFRSKWLLSPLHRTTNDHEGNTPTIPPPIVGMTKHCSEAELWNHHFLSQVLSTGFVGEVIKVDIHNNNNNNGSHHGPASLARVTLRRLLLPEHTVQGRRLPNHHHHNHNHNHNCLDVYEDADGLWSSFALLSSSSLKRLQSALIQENSDDYSNNNKKKKTPLSISNDFSRIVHHPHSIRGGHVEVLLQVPIEYLVIISRKLSRGASSHQTTTLSNNGGDRIQCVMSHAYSLRNDTYTPWAAAFKSSFNDAASDSDDALLLSSFLNRSQPRSKIQLRVKRIKNSRPSSSKVIMASQRRKKRNEYDAVKIKSGSIASLDDKKKKRKMRNNVKDHAATTRNGSCNVHRKVSKNPSIESSTDQDALEADSVNRLSCARLLDCEDFRKRKKQRGLETAVFSAASALPDRPRNVRHVFLENRNNNNIHHHQDLMIVAKPDEKSNSSRAHRAQQRRYLRDAAASSSWLLGVDTLAGRETQLRFGRSSVHGWGVYADEDIGAGDLIIEYRGVLIENAVTDKREKEYAMAKIGSDYMFRIDASLVCDATKQGNVARFINASCDPNCYTKIINHNGSKRIVIYAKRDIPVGEELSYDYKFPLEFDESKRITCHCGAKDCRGFMNWDKRYVAVKDSKTATRTNRFSKDLDSPLQH